MKKIYIGSDHAGYGLKFELVSYILSKYSDYEVFDCGTYIDESVDYPDFAQKVCENVLEDNVSKGILICGTGLGMSITANKFNGIRAALCNDTYSARHSVTHNDSNILVLGARIIGLGIALEIVDTFFLSEFEGGRHKKRLNMIKNIENKN